MNRHTLLAAVILTAAPLAAQAQDRDDATAMDNAYHAAVRSVHELTLEINHQNQRLAEVDDQVRGAIHAYKLAAGEFNENHRRALAEKRAHLARLGPDTPFHSPANATEAERRKARDHWVAQRLERDRLRDEIAPLAEREREFFAARDSYHHLSTQEQMMKRRLEELQEIRKTNARRHLLAEAHRHGWKVSVLRERYPKLF